MRLFLAAALAAAVPLSAAAQEVPAPAAAEGPVRDPHLLSSRPQFVSGDRPEDLPVVQAAAAQGRGGRVKITAVVKTDGTLRDVALAASSGDTAIDGAILSTVQQWKLTPARDRAGKLVEAVATLPFDLGAGPRKLAGDQPVFSDEAKALGHNGKVVVKAVIAESGALGDVTIVQSSRSPLLDEAVLRALAGWRYSPLLDLAGHPRTLEISIPFNFSQVESGRGSYLEGMRYYGCAAFIRETDWWQSTHADTDPSKQDFYTFVAGALYIAPASFGLKPGAERDIRALMQHHRLSWANAITRCRADPGSTFLAEYREG